MKETDYKINKKPISYEIEDNGYSIYLDGMLWMTQYDDCSKPFDTSKSFEENCIMQIEDAVKSFENAQKKQEEESTMKAQIDYLAMMSGIDLTDISDDMGGME